MQNNHLPQTTPAGFVLPGGIAGGAADASAGMFRQGFVETVFVVLVVRVAGDALGKAGLDTMTPIVRDVVTAVAGWGPDDAPGIYALGQGELVGAKDGALVFQLDFTLEDQLRITPS